MTVTGRQCRSKWFSATDFTLTRIDDLPKSAREKEMIFFFNKTSESTRETRPFEYKSLPLEYLAVTARLP